MWQRKVEDAEAVAEARHPQVHLLGQVSIEDSVDLRTLRMDVLTPDVVRHQSDRAGARIQDWIEHECQATI